MACGYQCQGCWNNHSDLVLYTRVYCSEHIPIIHDIKSKNFPNIYCIYIGNRKRIKRKKIKATKRCVCTIGDVYNIIYNIYKHDCSWQWSVVFFGASAVNTRHAKPWFMFLYLLKPDESDCSNRKIIRPRNIRIYLQWACSACSIADLEINDVGDNE